MITCTLGEKKYTVDFISGRALREMEPAAKMYGKIVAISNTALKGETVPNTEQLTINDAMDVMIKWFCLLFQNQFTPDEVLDGYPVDRLMHDIALALMAVQSQTTEILSDFPTKAAGVWRRSIRWTCWAFSKSGRGTRKKNRKRKSRSTPSLTKRGRP